VFFCLTGYRNESIPCQTAPNRSDTQANSTDLVVDTQSNRNRRREIPRQTEYHSFYFDPAVRFLYEKLKPISAMSRVTEFQQLVLLSRRFHRRPAHSAHDQAQELLLQQMWETACDYGQRAADKDDEQEEEEEQIRVRRRKRVRRRMLMMLLASTTSPQVVFRSSPRYWVKFSDPAWTAWWDAVYYREHSEPSITSFE
jgi:hypothetical protein